MTKIEEVYMVNLLHTTSWGFKQYQSRKPGEMLVSLPKYAPFHDSHQKIPAFRHRN